MCIGVNKQFGFPKNISLGKDIGKFDNLKSAMDKAESNNGSEIIYKDNKDNKFHVSEVKEEGFLHDTKNLNKPAKDYIKFDNDKLSKLGIKDPIVSFVEDDLSNKSHSINAHDILDAASNPLTTKKDLEHIINMTTDVFAPIPAGTAKALANNKAMTPELLTKLAECSNKFVDGDDIKKIIMNNPLTPKSIIYSFSTNLNSEEIRKLASEKM